MDVKLQLTNSWLQLNQSSFQKWSTVCISNTSAKKYQNAFTCVKVIANHRWDVFETQCICMWNLVVKKISSVYSANVACACMRVCVCMRVRACVCVYVFIVDAQCIVHACVYMCVCACVHVYAFIVGDAQCIVHVCVYMCVCACVCVCVYCRWCTMYCACMCVHVCVRVCVCMRLL